MCTCDTPCAPPPAHHCAAPCSSRLQVYKALRNGAQPVAVKVLMVSQRGKPCALHLPAVALPGAAL